MESIRIEDIASSGEGVGRQEKLAVFVPFTAPGDLITISDLDKRSSFARAKLKKLLEPSSLRITPYCSHFGVCGGCTLQHIHYQAQLEIKRNFIIQSLRRIAKIDLPIPPVVASPPWQYRQHISLHVQKGILGFYRYDKKDTLFDIQECPIFSSDMTAIQEELRPLIADIDEALIRLIKSPHRLIIHLSLEGSYPNFKEKITSFLKHSKYVQAVALSLNGISQDFGPTKLTLNILGYPIHFSVRAFLQNNLPQAEKIYQFLAEYPYKEGAKILDLYCGVGITSMLLAQNPQRSVVGIESNPYAIACARENQAGLFNLEFIEGKVEDAWKAFLPDVVIINPPRVGISPLVLAKIKEKKPPLLIYISCMPPTLSRDLKALSDLYTILLVQGYDLFPQTTHVETLCLLEIKK